MLPLAGPYGTEQEADSKSKLAQAEALAHEIDPFTWFDAVFVVRTKPGYSAPGLLNRLGKM